jgi:serine/threonine-protein kinase SRPK3
MSHAIKFDPGRFEVTEDRERYEPGGFHPVNIGDSFESYRVLHKLGNGGFATIWLARDSKSDRNVALKIIAAEESRTCSEAEILQYLATTDSPTHEGKDRVSLLLDHFWIEGPNGRHRCLVSEALGPSIAQLREDNVVLSIRQSQKVALQASQGLAFLHSVGIIHGGM